MAKINYAGFRFRQTRGGTPIPAAVLSKRGRGGVRLHIGEGKYAMMSEADAALPVAERARLVGLRQTVQIVNEALGDQLEGGNYWIWTDTEHEDYPGNFVLRRLGLGVRFYDRPVLDCGLSAVRFVEDK